MSELEEYQWMGIILQDVCNNYPDHHKGALIQIIQVISYRIECLEKGHTNQNEST